MLPLFSRSFNSKIILAVFIVITAFCYLNIHHTLHKKIQLDENVIFEIEKGENYNQIFSNLEKNKIIKQHQIHFFIFKIINKLKPNFYFKAGEYEVKQNTKYIELIEKFIKGETYSRKYTIIEGFTSYQIVDLLQQIEYLNGDIKIVPAEGSLLPDTYFYKKGDSRQDQITLMQNRMTTELEKIWLSREPSIPLKNKKELLILASIVEKETGLRMERDHVAGVFTNRIKQKMKLQSDPTVLYALTLGKYKLDRPIYKKDLRKTSNYNTYHIFGLPPSPIANPGLEALMATSRPKDTLDLYFVSDGHGKHKFSQTLVEHNRNVRKLREIEKNRKNEKK